MRAMGRSAGWRGYTVAAAISVALHGALIVAWLALHPERPVPQHETKVAVFIAPKPVVQAQRSPRRPLPATAPIPHVEALAPQPLAPAFLAADAPVVHAAEPAPAIVAAPAAKPAGMPGKEEQAPAEIEPDYKAAYLNNRLVYPLAAQRMGIQGRVVLNVEVLAEGVSGQINVQQGSGYAVLDRAAQESVRSWRFVPARRGGQPVTRWFKVPVSFTLKDD